MCLLLQTAFHPARGAGAGPGGRSRGAAEVPAREEPLGIATSAPHPPPGRGSKRLHHHQPQEEAPICCWPARSLSSRPSSWDGAVLLLTLPFFLHAHFRAARATTRVRSQGPRACPEGPHPGPEAEMQARRVGREAALRSNRPARGRLHLRNWPPAQNCPSETRPQDRPQ